MNITLFEIKTNTATKINNIKTVKVMGSYFIIIYKDDSQKSYSFHDFDFFIRRWPHGI